MALASFKYKGIYLTVLFNERHKVESIHVGMHDLEITSLFDEYQIEELEKYMIDNNIN